MKPTRPHPSSRHSRAPLGGARRQALVVLAALAPVVGLLVVAQPASSVPSLDQGTRTAAASTTQTVHKSYVCKYVGTPGVDERLQTGRNPIWVDNHALTGKDDSVVKVGDTFSDKHVKSVVIVANTAKLNPEPTVASCPAPVGPTKVTATPPSVTAPTCDKAGVLVVPADTASITYTSKPAGTGPGTYTVTATAATGYIIDGNATWTDLTVLPQLTGAACPTTVTPVSPTVVVSTTCNVQGSYNIPETHGVTYLLAGTPIASGKHNGPASGTVTAKAAAGHTLSTSTWSYALNLPAAAVCSQPVITVVTPVAPTVVQSTTCEVQGTYTIPATTGITYLLGGKKIAADTYRGPASGVVTAKANEGYTLSTTTWSFTLNVAAPAICPATEAPATGTIPATGGTTSAPTTALPKTGSPAATLGFAGALALLLGLALYTVGTRRVAPVRS